MALNALDFPPNGAPGFSTADGWDNNLNSLTEHIDVQNIKGATGGLILTLFDSEMERNGGIGMVVITVSYSNLQML